MRVKVSEGRCSNYRVHDCDWLLTYLLKNLFNHAGHTQHICKNTMG